MSTSEKFYNKKKTILFNFIREKNQKYNAMINEGRKFLKIGAHQITKIDFSKLEEEKDNLPKERSKKILFKKKIHQEKYHKSKTDSFFSESNSVVVIEKRL